MQEWDFKRRLPANGAQNENRRQLEGEVTYDADRDVVVQTAARRGEDVKLFAKIKDVWWEGKESNEKKD